MLKFDIEGDDGQLIVIKTWYNSSRGNRPEISWCDTYSPDELLRPEMWSDQSMVGFSHPMTSYDIETLMAQGYLGDLDNELQSFLALFVIGANNAEALGRELDK